MQSGCRAARRRARAAGANPAPAHRRLQGVRSRAPDAVAGLAPPLARRKQSLPRMSDPKVLVVYYSRTGNTRRVALEIARQLAAEVEEIGSLDCRQGVVGYLRSAYEAWSGRAARIRTPAIDPRAFDVVIVAGPIWVESPASPLRAYLAAAAPRLRNVAFVVTLGGAGADRALRQLQEIAGQPPIACFIVRERDLDDIAARAGRFAEQIRVRLSPPRARDQAA